MSKGLPFTPDELRLTLMEVLEVCPVDRCNPADCPLFPLRKMPRRERLRWFNALSQADLQYLAAYHRVCMGLKLAAGSPVPKSQSAIANRKSSISTSPATS